MFLNKTEFEFLKEILKNQTLYINDVAKKLKLTERAIRYKVDNLNYFFIKSNLSERLKLNKGFIELEGDKQNIHNSLTELSEKNYIFSNEERREYILIKFLFLENIKIEDICEELDVSRSTVKKDLKELRDVIAKEKLSLISKPRVGLILTGHEKDIRKMQLKYFSEYYDIKNYSTLLFKEKITPTSNRINLIFNEYFQNNLNFDIIFIFHFLKTLEKILDKIISDEGYKIMIFYIIIAINRISQKNILKHNIQNEIFLKSTIEFSIISKEINELETKFSIEFSSKELLQFSEYFLGTHSYNFKYSFYENWIEIETLVRDMIEEVDKKLEVDIKNDSSLEEGLINHLRPTIYRIKNNIKLDNPIYQNVMQEYPELFYTVEKALIKLEDFLNRKIDNEEIAFFTVHFKLALDRNVKKVPKKNILIVCEYGYGTSRLLSQEISNEFNVNVLEIVPYNKIINNEIDNEKIDLIISTLDFKLDNNIPVVKVSAILSEDNIKELENLGLKKSKTGLYLSDILNIIRENSDIKNERKLESDLKKYFGEKLIIDKKRKEKFDFLKMLPLENIKIIEEAANWEDSVKISAELLLNNRYIEAEYIEDILKTIKESGPYMIIGRDIILPHAGIEKNVHKTGFSFLRLKKAVEFPEGAMIKNIVTLASSNRDEHISALLELKKIIDKTDFLNELEGVSVREDILKLIYENGNLIRF